MKLLLVGATGLVGRHVLEYALQDAGVTQIFALARRGLPPHPKLTAPVVSFDHLPDEAPWWSSDAAICALGTTMRVAGSKEAFRRVDLEYPLAVARLARRHGTPAFILNSSVGASSSSRIFYTRVKGELEDALVALGFPSLTLVRPGFISGHRDEFRFGERLVGRFLGTVGPLLPRRWRLNPAERIARSLLSSAMAARSGVNIVSSDQLI